MVQKTHIEARLEAYATLSGSKLHCNMGVAARASAEITGETPVPHPLTKKMYTEAHEDHEEEGNAIEISQSRV
jgi:hypothetical protein